MRRSFVVLATIAMVLGVVAAPASATGNAQVSGLGLPGAPGGGPCDDAAHVGADYAIAVNGDLEGCVYGYITSYRFHEGSGTYQETADEVFIGTWGALGGSWEMVENFTAKFDPVTGDQVFGRCKHPIVEGSGTGDFEGITGRLDFKDDVDAGNAPFKGHLDLGS